MWAIISTSRPCPTDASSNNSKYTYVRQQKLYSNMISSIRSFYKHIHSGCQPKMAGPFSRTHSQDDSETGSHHNSPSGSVRTVPVVLPPYHLDLKIPQWQIYDKRNHSTGIPFRSIQRDARETHANSKPRSPPNSPNVLATGPIYHVSAEVCYYYTKQCHGKRYVPAMPMTAPPAPAQPAMIPAAPIGRSLTTRVLAKPVVGETEESAHLNRIL